jgi:hypothetical protein
MTQPSVQPHPGHQIEIGSLVGYPNGAAGAAVMARTSWIGNCRTFPPRTLPIQAHGDHGGYNRRHSFEPLLPPCSRAVIRPLASRTDGQAAVAVTGGCGAVCRCAQDAQNA